MKTEILIPPQHLGKNIEMTISIKSGDVCIQPSNSEMIEVDLPDLRKGTLEEMFEISMIDNKLTIKEKKNRYSGMNFMNFQNNSSDMVLSLPNTVQYNGELALYNGDLCIKDVNIAVVVNTYNGDISIQNVTADHFKLNSYNGDLNLQNFSGKLAVEQYNGDISCQACELTGIAIKSFSGDIDLKAKFNLQQDGSISTFSGDVSLHGDEYLTDKNIMISTMSGDLAVHGSIPEERIIAKNKMKTGMEFMKGFKPMMKGIFDSIGDTLSGQKDKIKTEIFNTSELAREAAEKKDANIERILQMLADGKISFEESERLIKLLKGA